MKKTIAALLLFLTSAGALAAAPQTGTWWSPSESGRGYAIDVQGSTLVMTSYAYGIDGRMQWYYADGPLINGGARWTGTLYKFDFGQPLNGAYLAPINTGNDGTVAIDFTSRSAGVLTLPGGRRVNIERYNFGVGSPPQSLLGDWIYVYTITSTFAERYQYTVILSATTTGNGVVATSDGLAGAEYQTSGTLAGYVFAAQFTSTGTVLNQYLWTPYLDEGRGSWISTSSNKSYGMNAYRIATASGILKSALGTPAPAALLADEAAKAGAPQRGVTLDELEARDPVVGQLAREMWSRLLESSELR